MLCIKRKLTRILHRVGLWRSRIVTECWAVLFLSLHHFMLITIVWTLGQILLIEQNVQQFHKVFICIRLRRYSHIFATAYCAISRAFLWAQLALCWPELSSKRNTLWNWAGSTNLLKRMILKYGAVKFANSFVIVLYTLFSYVSYHKWWGETLSKHSLGYVSLGRLILLTWVSDQHYDLVDCSPLIWITIWVGEEWRLVGPCHSSSDC